MPLIQCTSGPTTTPVGNENYVFARDPHGRAVCNVQNLRHAAILLGLDVYEAASDLGPVLVDPADPEAYAALEERCNQLIIDLGTAEAALVTANNQVAEEREIIAQLRRQMAHTEGNPAPAQQPPAPADDAMLLGSDNQPSFVEFGETSWLLGDIVARSHEESGLTAEAWNGLTQPEREARIAATIEIMRAPPAADNLQDISGIGAAAEKKLHAAGITSFAQIAAMSPEELAALDKSLGMGGISERSGWLDQAKDLVAKSGAAGNTETKGS